MRKGGGDWTVLEVERPANVNVNVKCEFVAFTRSEFPGISRVWSGGRL